MRNEVIRAILYQFIIHNKLLSMDNNRLILFCIILIYDVIYDANPAPTNSEGIP